MNNILQTLMKVQNPQQYAYQQLQQMANSNPIIANALNGNAESVVRNICKERNINADALMSQIQSQIYKR